VNLGLLGRWEKGVHLDPRACRASLDHLVSLACRELKEIVGYRVKRDHKEILVLLEGQGSQVLLD
jgi:hypothetical protein